MQEGRDERNSDALRILAGASCWQIDNDRLEGALADGEWQTELAKELIDLAEAQEGGSLLCATRTGMSADFGYPSFSVWLAIVGTLPLASACRDLVEDMIPREFRRREIAPANENWVSIIKIADGKAWVRCDDGAMWRPLSSEDQTGNIDDLEDFYDDETDEPWVDDDSSEAEPGETASTDSASPRNKKKKSTNAAHNGVGIGYYQRKIEKMFKFPKGSVRFVKPDGNIAHPKLLVRNLRAQWED